MQNSYSFGIVELRKRKVANIFGFIGIGLVVVIVVDVFFVVTSLVSIMARLESGDIRENERILKQGGEKAGIKSGVGWK